MGRVSVTILMLFYLVDQSFGNTVLFEDTFDSGTMSPEWVSKAATQWVENGWLHTKDTDGWPRDSMAVVHVHQSKHLVFCLELLDDRYTKKPVRIFPDWWRYIEFILTAFSCLFPGPSERLYVILSTCCKVCAKKIIKEKSVVVITTC